MAGYGKEWRDFRPPAALGMKAPRRAKYNNQRTAVGPELQLCLAEDAPAGWRVFDSKREAARFATLALDMRTGAISDLICQQRYPLTTVDAEGVRRVVGEYIADFSYTRDGLWIVEDVKGIRTELYKWKRRHVAAQYGVDIVEV